MGETTLFIDLGDAFVKCIALGSVQNERFRFPSAVASRLLSGGPEMGGLLLDERDALPRLPSFDAREFPRTRSFPQGAELAERVRAAPPAPGARFAGRLAALYGADRRLLGREPSAELVDALVHKALILAGLEGDCDADVCFVVDTGAKAAAVTAYAGVPRTTSLELRSYSHQRSRRLRLNLRGRIVDAAACIRATLPAELGPGDGSTLLAVDVGHFRTKLALLAAEGCVHRAEVPDLGVFELVRRILRDGQERGLVEDEFAVMRALENADGTTLEVAGRRFEVGAPLTSALSALAEELARVIERSLLEHFGRAAQPCRTLVLLGGGGARVEAPLCDRLATAKLGIDRIWLLPEPSFGLIEGARRLR